MVDVAVLSGSASDTRIMEKVTRILDEQGIQYDARTISAHREPDQLDAYVKASDAKVFIAIAGLSAALPGAIAARTERPVIGVPVSSALMGLDALLATAQMPRGVPVACVGIDAGENAAVLAVRILALRQG
jgi:5-(carboxyamino)imidazole ribonucleotide mutase